MLEIIALTPEEARIAEGAGAGRIELVAALSEGGLTPDFGIVPRTVAAVRIPVNVMIRPHSRNFCYTKQDLDQMEAAIRAAREAGANGVVLGVLDQEGRVDTRALERLLLCAGNLEVTFHRAIDEARDPVEAAGILSRYPAIGTILTSGGRGPIEAHAETLKRMREAAAPVRIMAGGGLTLENLSGLIRTTGLRDFHIGTAVRSPQAADGALDPDRLAQVVEIIASPVG